MSQPRKSPTTRGYRALAALALGAALLITVHLWIAEMSHTHSQVKNYTSGDAPTATELNAIQQQIVSTSQRLTTRTLIQPIGGVFTVQAGAPTEILTGTNTGGINTTSMADIASIPIFGMWLETGSLVVGVRVFTFQALADQGTIVIHRNNGDGTETLFPPAGSYTTNLGPATRGFVSSPTLAISVAPGQTIRVVVRNGGQGGGAQNIQYENVQTLMGE